MSDKVGKRIVLKGSWEKDGKMNISMFYARFVEKCSFYGLSWGREILVSIA